MITNAQIKLAKEAAMALSGRASRGIDRQDLEELIHIAVEPIADGAKRDAVITALDAFGSADGVRVD